MTEKVKYPLTAAIPLLLISVAATSNSYADYPIAGEDPSARPAGAPTISNATRDSQWVHQALAGVSQPYPASLSFLEDQGNWYTPFNNPGMPAPYDIRGWHRMNGK